MSSKNSVTLEKNRHGPTWLTHGGLTCMYPVSSIFVAEYLENVGKASLGLSFPKNAGSMSVRPRRMPGSLQR